MIDHSAATSGQDPPNAAATTAVSVEQAASILGVSITTVKRRIRGGSLRAEQAHRPQGTVWVVYLPAAAVSSATTDQPAASVAATAAATPSEQMATLMQATLTPIVGPLIAEQVALRQTVERQTETIGELREDRGRLAAELDAARTPHSPTARDLARSPLFWLSVAAAVHLALAAVLLRVWLAS